MPITRARARSLLNQKEMALYDDSRINGLRQLDARALASRIGRARTARDRARDLVQKHKLASRARTGSKRGASGQANQRSKDKAELMADILRRFEGRLREVKREAAPAKSAAARPARKASKTAKATRAKKPTGEARSSKKAAKKTSRLHASAKRAGAGTGAATTKTPASATSARKPAGKAARRRRITPAQALAQTQALLEARQAQAAAPKPWQDAPGGGSSADGQPGYQSAAARRRALRLHAAEARIPAIQGSISTRDRINQGKRDHRGGDDGD